MITRIKGNPYTQTKTGSFSELPLALTSILYVEIEWDKEFPTTITRTDTWAHGTITFKTLCKDSLGPKAATLCTGGPRRYIL